MNVSVRTHTLSGKDGALSCKLNASSPENDQSCMHHLQEMITFPLEGMCKSCDTLITRIYVFSVWPLPKVKHDSESRFEMRMSISIQTFFGAFRSVIRKSKKWFPIVLSKRDVALVGVNCGDRLGVLQSFWYIFYRKITGYFKIFDIWTLVIYLTPLP